MTGVEYYCDDTTATWGGWCRVTTSSATTSCGTTVWAVWSTEGTGTTNSTATAVWTKWSMTTNSTTTYGRQAPPRVLTAEERAKQEAEWAAQREAARVAEAKRKVEKEAADARAEELLRGHLSLRQRRSYRRARMFCVQARDGRRYRLKHGWAGNIEELDRGGRAVARLCIHPREDVPYADNLLAQKLLLETDADAFRRIANRTELPRPARRVPVVAN